jgi:hypothetical protein
MPLLSEDWFKLVEVPGPGYILLLLPEKTSIHTLRIVKTSQMITLYRLATRL